MKWVAGVLLVLGFIFTNFKMVQHGTRAVKLRWGRAIQDKKKNESLEYRPGFPPKWVFPGVVKLVSVSILDRQIEVQAQVQVAEYHLLNVAGVLNFSVTDNVEKLLYVVEDLEPFLRGRGLNALRESLTRLWNQCGQTINNAYVYHAQCEFRRIIDPCVARVGVELESVDLTVTEDPQMATARSLNRVALAIEKCAPEGQSEQAQLPQPPVSVSQPDVIVPVSAPRTVPVGKWHEVASTATEHGEDAAVFGKPRSVGLWHRTSTPRL